MTHEINSIELNRLFNYHAEDAQFRQWLDGAPDVRFVYVCEFGTIWKFTPREWWQFLRKTVNNQGAHDLVLSKALRSRPRNLTLGTDRRISSTDETIRCLNPLDWTIEDWTEQLSCPFAELQSIR